MDGVHEHRHLVRRHPVEKRLIGLDPVALRLCVNDARDEHRLAEDQPDTVQEGDQSRPWNS